MTTRGAAFGSWWARLSAPQRALIAVGVPVAAGAAILANVRDRSRSDVPSGPVAQPGALDLLPDNLDLLSSFGFQLDELAGDVNRRLEEQEQTIADRIAEIIEDIAPPTPTPPPPLPPEDRDRDEGGEGGGGAPTPAKPISNLKATPRAIIRAKSGDVPGAVGTTRTRYSRRSGAPTKTVGGVWSPSDYRAPSGARWPFSTTSPQIYRLEF